MTTIVKTAITRSSTSRFSPLRWLLRLDAAYRQCHNLKQATPEQLDDMGISFEQANAASFRKFAEKQPG